MQFLISIFCVFIALGSSPALAAPAPKELDVFYGNLLFGYWTLKLDNNQLVYEDHSAATPKPEIISTSVEKWNGFKTTLDEINAWEWKEDYRPARPGADGTQWKVNINYGDQKIISRGDNAYPDEEPDNIGMPGKKFTAFLEALKRLTGKDLH